MCFFLARPLHPYRQNKGRHELTHFKYRETKPPHQRHFSCRAHHRTRLKLELPAAPVYALADEQQLEQALVNMVKNALESLEEEGEVMMQIRKEPLTLVVADNGPGLSGEMQESWDTPFFSTKAGGQGIGLTLVREIARQHGGYASLETLESGWTESRITLS